MLLAAVLFGFWCFRGENTHFLPALSAHDIVKTCIFLQHKFLKAQVNIYVTVLQNDGSGKCSSSECASYIPFNSLSVIS